MERRTKLREAEKIRAIREKEKDSEIEIGGVRYLVVRDPERKERIHLIRLS